MYQLKFSACTWETHFDNGFQSIANLGPNRFTLNHYFQSVYITQNAKSMIYIFAIEEETNIQLLISRQHSN